MSALHLLSDHVYDWSARSLKQNIVGIAQASASIAAEAAAAVAIAMMANDLVVPWRHAEAAGYQINQHGFSRGMVLVQ